MSQKFCTACGAALSDGLKFCERCGSPVPPDSPARSFQPGSPAVPPYAPPPAVSPPPGGTRVNPKTVGMVLILVILIMAGVFFFVRPVLSGTGNVPGGLPGSVTTRETGIPVPTASLPAGAPTAGTPAQKPDPFPDALTVKERFLFGSGKVASEATVYKYWINDTYEWHNDMDNHYYVQRPDAGNKYLFVFVHMVNTGDTRVWFPSAGSVVVYSDNIRYYQDQGHYKPNKASDRDATPVEVKEVQYFQKLNGDEYAEDFGFSHGTELAYLYPGASNAVDGYIVYEVPQSLTPEETYVVIPFNARDQGVWRLG